MADIHLKCPGCDRVYRVPDHVADMSIKCWECGESVHTGGAQVETGGLDLGRSATDADDDPDSGLLKVMRPVLEPEPMSVRADSIPPPAPSALETVLEGAAPVKEVRSWPGYAAFGLAFGSMLLYQLQASAWTSYLDIYVWGRWIVLGALFFYVTFSAMYDNGWKGALCIIFPPYALFYAVTQVTSFPVQGALYGLLLGLGTEAFLLPDESLVVAAGPAFSMLVDEVNSWIKLASKPPI